MTAKYERFGFFRGLRFRIVVMLALALMPIGLIAVLQTKQLGDTARINAQNAILERTLQATSEEAVVLETARNVARSIVQLRPRLNTVANCQSILSAFQQATQRVSYIALVPRSGLIECSSTGQAFDVSERDGFKSTTNSNDPRVTVDHSGPLSGTSVVIVTEPYFDNAALAGFVSVSIPHSNIADNARPKHDSALLNLLTFNEAGEILTYDDGKLENAKSELPKSQNISDFIGQSPFSFLDANQEGQNRTYSVVKILDGNVYALGIWPASFGETPSFANIPPSLFPLLMWAASLAVVLLTVHRFVTRHVRALARQMNDFGKNRVLPPLLREATTPAEIVEMNTDFRALAEGILQDEAVLEDNLRDKNVLLKEVHHRVKNNLQLISSIMNMQIRRASTDEARDVLLRLQDRVLSLATIHRDLYQSSDAGRVDAGSLVREIVERTLEIGAENQDAIDLSTDIEPMYLYPDQAVPVSLLASEAATNTMKYAGHQTAGKHWIKVALRATSETEAELMFANSIGGVQNAESTGLGSQLINAFAMQLGGTVDIEHDANAYSMTVTFPIAEFTDKAVDY